MLGGHILAVDHHVFLLIWLLQRLLDEIDCDEKFDIPDRATQNDAYALHCHYESKILARRKVCLQCHWCSRRISLSLLIGLPIGMVNQW